MRVSSRSLLLTVILAGSAMMVRPQAARADQANEDEARVLFTEGKKAFDARDYQRAYDHFKRAYLLTPEPAFLYNMSSALQHLERPHEAAEALRAYLRVLPQDPERDAIERRILALEESQRLLDAERRAAAAATAPVEPVPAVEPRPAPTAPAPTAPAPVATPASVPPAPAPATSAPAATVTPSKSPPMMPSVAATPPAPSLVPPPDAPRSEPPRETRRTGVWVAVGVSVAAALVGGAVLLGLALQPDKLMYTPSTLGTQTGTR